MRLTGFVATPLLTLFLVTGTAAHAAPSPAAPTEPVFNNNITLEEVRAAQQAWGEALLNISQTHRNSNQRRARAVAERVIDSAYAYNLGPVLFKPTLTHGEQTFRTTREGALAYFVGGNRNFPNDSGFALKPWDKFAYQNAAVFINGNTALTTGNVMLTDTEGNVTTVDKTWGFKKDEKGQVRIVLHHSSLPFSPQ